MSTDTIPDNLTWEQVAGAVQQWAIEEREWGGYPIPVEHLPLLLEPTHPLRDRLEGAQLDTPDTVSRLRQQTLQQKGIAEIVNQWYCREQQCVVFVCRMDDGTTKAWLSVIPGQEKLDFAISCMGVCHVWSVEADERAMEKLESLIGKWRIKCYRLTGMFLETSERSGVTYVFRRLRPTVAMRPAGPRDEGMKVLCALCLHPLGYYGGSFAGAMVPTDDVICHLVMMRGDERRYWAACNQHPSWTPEAGL